MQNSNKEIFGFKTEVKQLLDLMIHSLYSNKEIFLRELISNSSDAIDKLRFKMLSDPNIKIAEDFRIFIDYNQNDKTISIEDNGIGMSKEEIMENLGTIAKSGTKEFISSLKEKKDVNLIGQFGVGFYSSFIVAKKIVVVSRKYCNDINEAVIWTSEGEGSYEITDKVTKESIGTIVTLHLKDNNEEFLSDWRLKQIIKKYSDHISLPIFMNKEIKDDNNNKNFDENINSSNSVDNDDIKDANIIDENKINIEDKKKIIEKEIVNKAKSLWVLPKSNIADNEYIELYKYITHDYENPLFWLHNKVEGSYNYISLLYIPKKAPYDLWTVNKDNKGLRLYVKRIFILDKVDKFLPNYLRFVRGIIDCDELPLNISREILQDNKIIDVIKKSLTKKMLISLDELSINNVEKYVDFWSQFGQVLKEGPAEDYSNKDFIVKLLRFSSTYNDDIIQSISLDDYIKRMKNNQKEIYYIALDSFESVKNSPHLEVFRKNNIEVLLLSDRVDEWLMTHLLEYDGKKIKSIAKGNVNIDDLIDNIVIEKKEEMKENELSEFLNRIKNILKDDVKDVRITNRLIDSPACIVVDEYDITPQMERIMRGAGQNVPKIKPILELNYNHKIIKKMLTEVDSDKFESFCNILLCESILAEGGRLQKPFDFVKRLNSLLIN